MGLKITCTENPLHKRFSVTAHVSQEWEVNQGGTFQKCLQDSIDTIHAPDKDDYYLCMECSTQAKVKQVPDANYAAECPHCGRGLDNVGDKCEDDECPGFTKTSKAS